MTSGTARTRRHTQGRTGGGRHGGKQQQGRAAGRQDTTTAAQVRTVREYLRALDGEPPPAPEQLRAHVASLAGRIEATSDPLQRLELIQRRLDTEAELARTDGLSATRDELEERFVEIVGDYSARRGISYPAWREAGVSAAVLRRAGIPLTRRPHTG